MLSPAPTIRTSVLTWRATNADYLLNYFVRLTLLYSTTAVVGKMYRLGYAVAKDAMHPHSSCRFGGFSRWHCSYTNLLTYLFLSLSLTLILNLYVGMKSVGVETIGITLASRRHFSPIHGYDVLRIVHRSSVVAQPWFNDPQVEPQ